MNYATFPSTVNALMQLILRHYPKGQEHTGPAMISEAEFAEGIGHAFTQMHALVLTNKRREFLLEPGAVRQSDAHPIADGEASLSL